jgi:Fe-S cluster assembly protein SufD
VEIDRPIQLVFVSGGQGRPTLSAPRLLIAAGEDSRLTIIENHLGDGGAALSCPVSEIVLDSNARLSHVVTQEDDPSAYHLASREIRLAAGSSYDCQSVSLGGALTRTDIGVSLDGEQAEASLDGLYLTDGRQQADTHLTMRHGAPNCESHQLYKGVLAGRSRTVFNGRIVVDQDSQRTDANQANRNLLLSDDAVAHSNPQLEIFADDVRCTHGSTVGKLDEEAIFYMRSRGIGSEDARSLLTLAFAGEVLDRVPVEQVRDRLFDAVAARLSTIEEAL